MLLIRFSEIANIKNKNCTKCNNNEIRTENSYENFKQKLITEFRILNYFSQILNKFLLLKQKPMQSIEKFSKMLELKVTEFLKHSEHDKKESAKNFVDSYKLKWFVKGFRSDIFEIRNQGMPNFVTVEVATEVQSVMQVSNEAVNNI